MFGELSVLIINDIEWFGATEAATALSFSNPHNAIKNHIEKDDLADHEVIDSLGRKQKKKFVNETGLYDLIFGAAKQGNNPEIQAKAKKYKRWVTSDVLPSIRKHGVYATDRFIEEAIKNPDFAIKTLQAFKEERERRIEVERINNVLMHVNKTFTATEIAKEMGFRSAAELNKHLAEKGIQFRSNGTWVLYSDYASKGYVEIKQEVLGNGKVIYHRKFTQRGREFVLKLFKCELDIQSK